MDLNQLIRNRRTIQSFSPEKVPDAAVKEALELSLWALNHRLTFPWFYKIASQSQRDQLADLAVELKGKKSPVSEPVAKSMKIKLLNPSHYVALGVKREQDPVVAKENYATLSCSVQLASLVLWEKGIGSKWSTSGFSVHARTYDILGVSPEQIQLEGCLLIGMPAEIPKAVERPSIEEILGF